MMRIGSGQQESGGRNGGAHVAGGELLGEMGCCAVLTAAKTVKAERGLPTVARTDNGPEFAGRTMQTWVAKSGVELCFIRPGKLVQYDYIESFNSRFRDECLSRRWFAGLSHMRSVIDNAPNLA